MKVEIGDRFGGVIQDAVQSGNFTSAGGTVTGAVRRSPRDHDGYRAETAAALAMVDAEMQAPG